MGAKLVNCCKPEQMGTTEYGKMLKRIQTLEDTRKEYQRLLNKFEMEGFMAQKLDLCGSEKGGDEASDGMVC